MFSDNLLVLAPIVQPGEIWRRVSLDMFREILRQEPLFRSEVLFNTADSSSISSTEMGSFCLALTQKIEKCSD